MVRRTLDPAAGGAGGGLYEDAPCGYLSTRPAATIVKVNRTLLEWTGYGRDELLGRRFQDLLTAGGRIYHETHYAPLLRMQGAVREIALELVCADGRRLPVLSTPCCAPTTRAAAADPHDGLRRDRPPPLRARAAARARGRARRAGAPSACSDSARRSLRRSTRAEMGEAQRSRGSLGRRRGADHVRDRG